MSTETNVSVFASGNGSNFQSMLEHDAILKKIKLLVCDKPGAPVIERANRYNVPVKLISPAEFTGKEAYERDILTELRNRDIHWIFLAGYMRLIGATLLHAYTGKIVNIHPSLLPAFPGLDAIGQAIRTGATETGVTIHYVDAGMDTGAIIAQQCIPVLPGDTVDELTQRVQKVEHALYPETIKRLINT